LLIDPPVPKKKKKKKKKLWNTLKHMKRYIYAQETTGKR